MGLLKPIYVLCRYSPHRETRRGIVRRADWGKNIFSRNKEHSNCGRHLQADAKGSAKERASQRTNHLRAHQTDVLYAKIVQHQEPSHHRKRQRNSNRLQLNVERAGSVSIHVTKRVCKARVSSEVQS